MAQYVLILSAVLWSTVSSSVLKNELFPLDIIHYNDFHDRFVETSVKLPICATNNTACLGGFARLVYEIRALLREKPDAILLNAGDSFQGTYWYTFLKWHNMQRFMNMLPHDAHTLGNHEFDDGLAGLAPYLAALRAPVVVANIDTSQEPTLEGLYRPYIVIERKGRKIGIIGVTTQESKIISNTGNIRFMDPVQVVKEQAELLTEQDVNVIVVLSHCGYRIDQIIAREAGENVDIIVGGHSHFLFWNSVKDGPAPSAESVQATYPVNVTSRLRPEHTVLIVHTSAFTKYLGNISLYLDSKGELVSCDGGPVFLNRSIPEDPEIKALLAPEAEKLHATVKKKVGEAKVELTQEACFVGECAIGDYVIDAFVNRTNQDIPSNYTTVGLILANQIRAGFGKGDITVETLVSQLPFIIKVICVDIAGRHIVEAIELAISDATHKKAYSSKHTPMVAGMHLTINGTSGRVESASVMHETGPRPLALEETYRLTTLEYFYHGGSGLYMLKRHGKNLKVIGMDEQIYESYVQNVSPLDNKLDGRLVIVK